jgi:hypothetical protein
MQPGQLQESGGEGIFFAVGVAVGDHVSRPFTANNAKPQKIFLAFVGDNTGMVGGTIDFHRLTSLLSIPTGTTSRAPSVGIVLAKTKFRDVGTTPQESIARILHGASVLSVRSNVKNRLKYRAIETILP